MFNRVMTKDNIAVVTLLEHRASGARLIVANAHITWEPQFRDVKLVQVAMLMEELNKISNDFARLPARMNLAEGYDKAPHYSSGAKIPTIICGDFNSEPDSGVYEYLSTGHVEKNHGDFMDHVYGDYAVKGASHGFKLKSAYSHVNELPFTNFTPGFTGESFHVFTRFLSLRFVDPTWTHSLLLRHDRLCLVHGPVTRRPGFARRPRPRLSFDDGRLPELPLPVRPHPPHERPQVQQLDQSCLSLSLSFYLACDSIPLLPPPLLAAHVPSPAAFLLSHIILFFPFNRNCVCPLFSSSFPFPFPFFCPCVSFLFLFFFLLPEYLSTHPPTRVVFAA